MTPGAPAGPNGGGPECVCDAQIQIWRASIPIAALTADTTGSEICFGMKIRSAVISNTASRPVRRYSAFAITGSRTPTLATVALTEAALQDRPRRRDVDARDPGPGAHRSNEA